MDKFFQFLIRYRGNIFKTPRIYIAIPIIIFVILILLAIDFFSEYLWTKAVDAWGPTVDNWVINILQWIKDHPEMYLWYVGGFLFAGLGCLLIWQYIVTKREVDNAQQKVNPETKPLVGLLTDMHDRMRYMLTIREKQRINKRQFELASPVLLDKLDLVKLGKWEKFKNKWRKKVNRVVPKSPKKRDHWWNYRYKIIGKANEIKAELIGSKKWEVKDAVIVGDWLDSLNIGLKSLRDSDSRYQELVIGIRQYMDDPVLRGLIEKHMSLSYAYYSTVLDLFYSRTLVKNDFEAIAHSAIVGAEIKPENIESALGEVVEEINKRQAELICIKENGFYFEFNDSSITTKDGRIIIGVTYTSTIKVTVETLQLEYNNNRFRPTDWNPIEINRIHTKHYTFDSNSLKTIADESLQEAILIAKVTGIEYRSHPFNIYCLLNIG